MIWRYRIIVKGTWDDVQEALDEHIHLHHKKKARLRTAEMPGMTTAVEVKELSKTSDPWWIGDLTCEDEGDGRGVLISLQDWYKSTFDGDNPYAMGTLLFFMEDELQALKRSVGEDNVFQVTYNRPWGQNPQTIYVEAHDAADAAAGNLPAGIKIVKVEAV